MVAVCSGQFAAAYRLKQYIKVGVSRRFKRRRTVVVVMVRRGVGMSEAAAAAMP